MKSRQKGYYAPTFTAGAVTMALVLVGVVGWCAIEVLLWLLSFVSINFGG